MQTQASFAGPFAQPGRWYRGNLHVHTTASDGDRIPEEVIDWYRRRGYHFLALTDHRLTSESRLTADGFLVIAGIEVDGHDVQAGGLYHLVGLGLQRDPAIDWDAGLTMQQAADKLRDAGGMVMLAHPYWSGQPSKDLLRLTGCFALEVYNGGCEVDDAKGFSSVHWDDLLSADRRLWATAVDDAHWRNGSKDAGLGWVWVKAQELTQAAILESLARGWFYASSGPEFYELALDPDQCTLTVRCSPAVWVDFVGNGWHSRRITAPAGQTLTQVTYPLPSGQSYVRVACCDSQGHWAWSNPVFLDVLQWPANS